MTVKPILNPFCSLFEQHVVDPSHPADRDRSSKHTLENGKPRQRVGRQELCSVLNPVVMRLRLPSFESDGALQ